MPTEQLKLLLGIVASKINIIQVFFHEPVRITNFNFPLPLLVR